MYKVKQFSLPSVPGISPETMAIHLQLYEGYVKNLNGLSTTLTTLKENKKENTRTITEVARRIGFELAGVINHELYFSALSGGPRPCPSHMQSIIEKQFQSFEAFVEDIANMARETRGIGWVLVLHDTERNVLHPVWVADHEIGGVCLPCILAVDMWEHAYLRDYTPKEKGDYVRAYMNAINWEVVADRLTR